MKKKHRPGFLSPGFERSATTFDNGPAKVTQTITTTFGPYGPTNREPSSPAHPVGQKTNCERKTGAKELESSLRGTPIQWLSLQSDVRATKARTVGNKKKEMLTHQCGRLAKQKAGTSGSVTPPNPSHTHLGWGRGFRSTFH